MDKNLNPQEYARTVKTVLATLWPCFESDLCFFGRNAVPKLFDVILAVHGMQ